LGQVKPKKTPLSIFEILSFEIFFNDLGEIGSRVDRSKKTKKAKFGHKQFQKRPNPEK